MLAHVAASGPRLANFPTSGDRSRMGETWAKLPLIWAWPVANWGRFFGLWEKQKYANGNYGFVYHLVHLGHHRWTVAAFVSGGQTMTKPDIIPAQEPLLYLVPFSSICSAREHRICLPRPGRLVRGCISPRSGSRTAFPLRESTKDVPPL